MTNERTSGIMLEQNNNEVTTPPSTLPFVIDIEVSLTFDELNLFNKLRKELGETESVAELYRRCARERCAELINLYKNK